MHLNSAPSTAIVLAAVVAAAGEKWTFCNWFLFVISLFIVFFFLVTARALPQLYSTATSYIKRSHHHSCYISRRHPSRPLIATTTSTKHWNTGIKRLSRSCYVFFKLFLFTVWDPQVRNEENRTTEVLAIAQRVNQSQVKLSSTTTQSFFFTIDFCSSVTPRACSASSARAQAHKARLSTHGSLVMIVE